MKTLAAKPEKNPVHHDPTHQRLTMLEETIAALAERTQILEASESLRSASREIARSKRNRAKK